MGFITNHSYLDNPTFRGMRQSLMNSFNDIYILDLHGNSLKKERCPDGSKDENVFDIRQGTAIALFVKEKDMISKNDRILHHSELWGLRKKKYDWLLKNDITTTKWKRLSPKSEFYFFIPRDERLLESYEKSPKVTDIFPINSVGIVTARDKFVIDTDRKALERRIRMFCDKKVPDELIQDPFKLKDKSNWNLKVARERVRNDKDWENSITKILYRPFDIKWIFYHDDLIERSRKKVMRHMMQENLSLCFMRQVSLEGGYTHCLISQHMVDNRTFLSSKGIIQQAPLYIYPDPDKKDLFSHIEEAKGKQPNISKKVFSALSKAYKKEPTPEEVFYYIYAVLYSNAYRTKYSEFLRVDFPRVPFTKEHKLFEEMGEYGKRLVDLHLLQSSELDPPVARFQGKGNNKVEKVKYNEKEARIYINQDQYFEGVAQEIWEYRIGGYQVCNKWLKDRKGGTLSLEDIKRYCKVATAIQRTIKVQRNIDAIYSEVEKGIIEF